MRLRFRTLLPLRGTSTLLLLAAGLAGTAFGQLLYTPNYGTGKISEFSTSGGPLSGLSCLSAPPANTIASAAEPQGLAMTPNGNYLYTADSGSNGGINAYSVSAGPCVGNLTALPSAGGCPTASGETCPLYSLTGNPYAAAVDPTGKYLYVTLTSGSIVAYQINSATGALNYANTYSTAATPGPILVASAGGNEYLYVGLTAEIAVYPIQSGGALGTPSTYSFNSPNGAPGGLSISGTTLYVTDNSSSGTNGLYAYPINGAGTLGTPATANTGNGPLGVALDNSATYLYVVNEYDGSVWSFLTGNLGASPTTNSLGTGSIPYGVTVDPTSNDVYVADQYNNEIWAFTPGLAGSVSGSPFSVGLDAAPGEFLLAHQAPTPPPTPPVPAASYTSLALLAILLAACAGLMYRKSLLTSSVR